MRGEHRRRPRSTHKTGCLLLPAALHAPRQPKIDMIRALDQHRRGNKQTVEVRHVHIYPGAQGVVGIVNAGDREGGGQK